MKARNGNALRSTLIYSTAPVSSYYYMQAPDEPSVEINIEQPETEEEDPPEEIEEAEDALQEIGSRVTALEARITEGLEGERSWNRTEISSLKTELADLKATLAQVATNLPAQITAMREELIRRLQDAQAEVSQNEMPELEEMDPPNAPPENEEDTQEIVNAPDVPRNERDNQRRRNRIV